MTGTTIYNSTDGPLLIDRAGRVLGARERRDNVDVDASPVAGHIAAGRLVVISPATDDTVEASDAAEQPTEGRKATRRTSTPTHEEA